MRVKEVADFKVFTKGAGSGELSVSVKGPSESDVSLSSLHHSSTLPAHFENCFFLLHFLLQFCLGTSIDRENAKSVPLYHPVHFTHAYLLYDLSSAGAEEQVKVQDAGDGVYECEYYPLKPGKYTVSITWGGHPIPRRLVQVRSPHVSIHIANLHSGTLW